MRYAIISDIHANIAALRAVLADAQDLKAEKIICLGDVLGYGPDPVPALETIYSRAHVCLAGNHDDAVCGRCSAEDFNEFAAAAVSRQRRALTPQAIAWLKNLPYECSMDGFACAHGDFSDPKNFNYVQEAEDALPSWETREEPLLFVGHTHEPCVFALGSDGVPQRYEPGDFTLEPGVRYLVNVGSVGYPRSGIGRSSYCIYDSDTKSVFFRSLPFDLEGYREKMGGKGLDEAPWMTARAAARATPLVRSGAKFGKAIVRQAPAKVLTVEHSQSRPSMQAEEAPRGKSWITIVLAAMLAVGLGGVLAYSRLGTRGPKPETASARPQLKVVPPTGAETAVQEKKSAVALQPQIANTLVEKRELKLAADDRQICFAVKLGAKSNPAKVRLAFADAKGKALPERDVVFQPVATGISRATKRNAVPVPEGAAEVALEVHRIERLGLTEVASIELDTKELKRGKKK